MSLSPRTHPSSFPQSKYQCGCRRDGSAVKNSCHLSRGPKLTFQNPCWAAHNSLQLQAPFLVSVSTPTHIINKYYFFKEMQANRGVIRMTTLFLGIPLQAFRDGVLLWLCSSGRGLGVPVSYSILQSPRFPGRGPPVCLLYMPTSIKSFWNWVNTYRFLHGEGPGQERPACCLFPGS